jgi:hypothetical protein
MINEATQNDIPPRDTITEAMMCVGDGVGILEEDMAQFDWEKFEEDMAQFDWEKFEEDIDCVDKMDFTDYVK